MKKRVISAIIASLIFIPVLLKGGIVFQIFIYLISILALREFIGIRESKKQLPNFIKFISYIIITLLVLGATSTNQMTFSIDYRIITALFLVFLIPTVLYHDRELYSVNDAFYLIGGIFFLGVAFALSIVIRNASLDILIYLLIITIVTDTFALITGMLIGKHKLLESISPKKTLEGMIGGTLFAVFIATIFYRTVIGGAPLYVIVLITFFLSIIGQFGDLVFSSIKRYFNKKDFSNIMPGHGGILDRLDSVIFVVLCFMFFMSII